MILVEHSCGIFLSGRTDISGKDTKLLSSRILWIRLVSLLFHSYNEKHRRLMMIAIALLFLSLWSTLLYGIRAN